MNLTPEAYMAKLKQAGWSNQRIAERLGWTEEQVAARWEEIFASSVSKLESGYIHLVQHFNNLSLQYNLLGESLKILGAALDQVPLEELRRVFAEIPQEQAAPEYISENFMVFRKFIPPDISAGLEVPNQDN